MVKSSVVGVYFDAKSDKWIANVYKDGRRTSLYSGESMELAEEARVAYDKKNKLRGFSGIPQSKIQGVSFVDSRGKHRWVARGHEEGKSKILYWGESKEEAERVRLAWDVLNPRKAHAFVPQFGHYAVEIMPLWRPASPMFGEDVNWQQ